jgi:hypothetical protein
MYKILQGKPEGKRPLGRPRHKREDWLGGVDWIRLAQDRDRWRAVVSAVMNLRVLEPRSELRRSSPHRHEQQSQPLRWNQTSSEENEMSST